MGTPARRLISLAESNCNAFDVLLLVAPNEEHESVGLRVTEFEGRDVLPSGGRSQPILVEHCARRVGRLGDWVLIEERSHDASGPHLAGFVDDQFDLLRFGPAFGILRGRNPEQYLRRNGVWVLRLSILSIRCNTVR
jgi:hypothetical protein